MDPFHLHHWEIGYIVTVVLAPLDIYLRNWLATSQEDLAATRGRCEQRQVNIKDMNGHLP